MPGGGYPRRRSLAAGASLGPRVLLERFAEAFAYRGVKATLALSDH